MTAISPPSERAKGKSARSGGRQRTSGMLLWFAVPALVFYAFALVVPTLRGAVFAFTDWNGLSQDFSFVGFDNFVDVFNSSTAMRAIGISLLIAFVYTVFVNLFGLLFALGVHSMIKSRNFLRVLLFAPAVMTPVVTAYLWKYILVPTGPMNELLEGLGLGALRQEWLATPEWATFSIILVMVWQYSGYHMVIFLAGLQGIPTELLEAASVDGAASWRKFWSITLPLLAPAITINLMLSIIGGLKVFDTVWVMTGGGPGGATHTLSTLIYRNAFQFGEVGPSIALAMILFVLVGVISGAQYRGLLKQEKKL